MSFQGHSRSRYLKFYSEMQRVWCTFYICHISAGIQCIISNICAEIICDQTWHMLSIK